jgi:hypothetical protein
MSVYNAQREKRLIQQRFLTLENIMTDTTTNKPNGDAFKPVRVPERRKSVRWNATATKSRISNGKDMLAGIDGRSAVARRFRDIAVAVTNDLGGPTECSAALTEIIRRFAGTCVLAEQLETRLINGQPVNSAEHCLLASTLCRLAARIGVRRIPRSLQTPSLRDYFEQAEQQATDDDEAA